MSMYSPLFLLLVLGCWQSKRASSTPRGGDPAKPLNCAADGVANIHHAVRVAPQELKGSLTLAGLKVACRHGSDLSLPYESSTDFRTVFVDFAATHSSEWERLCPGVSAEQASRSDLGSCRFESFGLSVEQASAFWWNGASREDAALRAMMLGVVAVRMTDEGGLDTLRETLLFPDQVNLGADGVPDALPIVSQTLYITSSRDYDQEELEEMFQAVERPIQGCYWLGQLEQPVPAPEELTVVMLVHQEGELYSMRFESPPSATTDCLVSHYSPREWRTPDEFEDFFTLELSMALSPL